MASEIGDGVLAASAHRQSEVLDVAAELFAQKGYHAASIRDLADRLAMKPASLYYHFRSKDQALYAVCERGMSLSLKIIDAAIQAQDFESQIRLLIKGHAEELARYGDYIKVYFEERLQLPAPLFKQLEKGTREARTKVEGMLQQAMKSGRISATVDIRLATLVIVATLRALAQYHEKDRIRNFDAYALYSTEVLLFGMATTDPA